MNMFQIAIWGPDGPNDTAYFLLAEAKEQVEHWAVQNNLIFDQLWDMGNVPQLPTRRANKWGNGVEVVCGPLVGTVYNIQHIESWAYQDGMWEQILPDPKEGGFCNYISEY